MNLPVRMALLTLLCPALLAAQSIDIVNAARQQIGVTVTYDKEGYPDFTSYRHPTVKDVEIEFTGSYPKDNGLADKAAGITREMRTNERYVWHHHQDGKTMQLIKQDVHAEFFHTGGMAGTRKEIEECNSTE